MTRPDLLVFILVLVVVFLYLGVVDFSSLLQVLKGRGSEDVFPLKGKLLLNFRLFIDAAFLGFVRKKLQLDQIFRELPLLCAPCKPLVLVGKSADELIVLSGSD